MKKFVFLVIPFLVGCLSAGTQVTDVHTNSTTVNQEASYDGGRARVAVAEFDCGSGVAGCYDQAQESITKIFSGGLSRSPKFTVLARGNELDYVVDEIEANPEYFDESTVAEKGHLEGADIIATGKVIAIKDSSQTRGGSVAVPDNIPVIGGGYVAKNDAYVHLEIRLIDVRQGRVINATRIIGKSSDYSMHGIGGFRLGNTILGGFMSQEYEEPVMKAISVVVDRAVNVIEDKTPDQYFRGS